MKIKCPYCFEEFNDFDVHFRSELLSPSGDSPDMPYEYDDYDDFKRHRHEIEKEIQEKVDRFYFFQASDDPKYLAFWNKFGGTSEEETSARRAAAPSYKRKVIDPNNKVFSPFLKKQPDGSFFLKDSDGIVEAVQLVNDQVCRRRVCPHCHNPIPDGYGKNPVKIATVIGITGSGKTVFLSQLLKKIALYSNQVGLNCIPISRSTNNFLVNNAIIEGKRLPHSTPYGQFQQPLFFSMEKKGDMGNVIKQTFVLYDVAGELFEPGNAAELANFAPYVKNSDGIICLIDPFQIEAVQRSATANGMSVNSVYQFEVVNQAISAIHGILSRNNAGQCNIPLALCISKADNIAVQDTFGQDLTYLLSEQIEGIRNNIGLYSPIFNAKQYAPICKELEKYLLKYPDTNMLVGDLEVNYSDYSLFAFTAMGCDVREEEETLVSGLVCEANSPVGPVEAIRIEEPLLWLFYKFGFISRNSILPMDDRCPNCHHRGGRVLPEGSTYTKKTGKLPWQKETYSVNRECQNPACGRQWYQE